MEQHLSNKSFSLLYLVLAALIVIGIFVTIHDIKGNQLQNYQTIKIQAGDTLWSLGSKYEGTMSTPQFINWVETHNHLTDRNVIQVGQQIVLPVKTKSFTNRSNQVKVADSGMN